jgi:hypothetical protein
VIDTRGSFQLVARRSIVQEAELNRIISLGLLFGLVMPVPHLISEHCIY